MAGNSSRLRWPKELSPKPEIIIQEKVEKIKRNLLPALQDFAAQAVNLFYSPFRRKRSLLFLFFRDDRLEEGVCRHHLPLLGRELNHIGVVIGEFGFHQVVLIVYETIIRLRVCVALLFLIYCI